MDDGSMTCDFTSFSTVFQSYEDDGQMIMKGLCNGSPFTAERSSPQMGLEPGNNVYVICHAEL